MIFKKIKDENTFYLSNYKDIATKEVFSENVYPPVFNAGGLGDVLVNGSIQDILSYVQTELLKSPSTYIDTEGVEHSYVPRGTTLTDFQQDAIFQALGDNGIITTEHKWYAIQLEDYLFLIVLLKENAHTTYFPFRPTYTGSLNDLIGHVYSILA